MKSRIPAKGLGPPTVGRSSSSANLVRQSPTGMPTGLAMIIDLELAAEINHYRVITQ